MFYGVAHFFIVLTKPFCFYPYRQNLTEWLLHQKYAPEPLKTLLLG